MSIEVEMRGPLSKSELDRLKSFLSKQGTFKTTKNRLLIDYSTFLEKDIRNRRVDFRARVTNGVPEMIIKIGRWGGSDTRKEISVLLQEGQFSNLVKAFSNLGYKKGVLAIRNSQVYEYEGIEFALAEVPNHSYYFEAELLISSENEVRDA